MEGEDAEIAQALVTSEKDNASSEATSSGQRQSIVII